MRIGYFGGSFDPPHRGHLLVAQVVRERFALDEVLLAPTGRQPLKPDGAAAPFDDRLTMTRLLCEGSVGLTASAVDAPRADGSPNYSVDTLTRLRAALPYTATIFSILGADAFLSLPHWRDLDELFRLAEWVVVSRPGSSPRDLQAMRLRPEQQARVHMLSDMAEPTSATEIRRRLRAHEPCGNLLPPALCEYIQERGLYLR